MEVETLLDDLLGATEKRVAVDAAAAATAAAAAAAAVAEEGASQTRRPVSELRMLFASNKPGTPVGTAAGATSALRQVASAAGGLISGKKRAGTPTVSVSAAAAPDGSALSRAARVGSTRKAAAAAATAALPGGRLGRSAGGDGGPGRPKRASPSPTPTRDGRRSPRRSSDPTGKLTPAGFRAAAGPETGVPSDGLSEVTRRRLRRMGGDGSGTPQLTTAGETTRGRKKGGATGPSSGSVGSDAVGTTTNASRRARFARQRSRSLSSPPRRGSDSEDGSDGVSGTGETNSASTSPRPPPTTAVPTARRGSRSRPPPISLSSRSGSWGIASGKGRSLSRSPRAASPSSTDGGGGASRSPSPTRAGGIPRPPGGGGGGGGFDYSSPRAVSPRAPLPSGDPRQGFPSLPRSSSAGGRVSTTEGGVDGVGDDDSAIGGTAAAGTGAGTGRSGATLTGTAIEAAAMSFVTKEGGKKSGGGTEHLPVALPAPGPLDSNADQPNESDLPASKSVGKGVQGEKAGARGDADGGAGKVGTGASRPSSRGTSVDSVGDVVIVGGLALENHRGFPGEDWSPAQSGAPGSSQVGFFWVGSLYCSRDVWLVPTFVSKGLQDFFYGDIHTSLRRPTLDDPGVLAWVRFFCACIPVAVAPCQ